MDDRAESPEPEGPKPIRRLEQSLVNRIAAGEVSVSNLKCDLSLNRPNGLYKSQDYT